MQFHRKKKKVFRFLLGLMVNQLYFLPCYKELVFKEELGLIKISSAAILFTISHLQKCSHFAWCQI